MNIQKLKKKIDEVTILEDISFSLNPNELVGLIGKNGSGKTTLFRTISGQYILDEGEILIGDQSLANVTQLKESIFYIDEKENFLTYYSIEKINKFYRLAYPKFDQSLYLELMHDNKLTITKPYRQMSKGIQGLYKIILAISSNAEFLLLDEPFDGLDVSIRKNAIGLLLEHISNSNRTAIIASHNLNELQDVIDRALLIKDKKIQKDYPLERIREKSRKIQLVFRSKQIPPVIKQHSKLISRQGRVLVTFFENYDDDIKKRILQLDPLLFEELPLTLEDLFEMNLRQELLVRDERQC